MAIESVKDRSDIPVIMQIITYAGVCAGMTQKEIHENNESFQKAKKFPLTRRTRFASIVKALLPI